MTEGSQFTLTSNSIYECIECCSCGIKFMVPGSWRDSMRSSKERFYCPNGHTQSYNGSSINQLREKHAKELVELAAKKDREIKEKNERLQAQVYTLGQMNKKRLKLKRELRQCKKNQEVNGG